MLNSYGKVWGFYTHRLIDQFPSTNVEITVEEKIDGSQFSFGKINGELHCRSKNVSLNLSDPAMFALAVDTAQELYDQGLLVEGWTYRGEFLQAPRHNTLEYGRTPDNYIILFDVVNEKGEHQNRQVLEEVGKKLGLEVVPLLYQGQLLDQDEFNELLTKESILGKATIEGVVIKARHLHNLRDGSMLKGKIVNDWFKEKNGDNHKQAKTKDVLTTIADMYRTEARYLKAIQQMKEEGTYTNELCDIGPLLAILGKDLHEEYANDIKEELFKSCWKTIAKKANAGFPTWFKNYLEQEITIGK